MSTEVNMQKPPDFIGRNRRAVRDAGARRHEERRGRAGQQTAKEQQLQKKGLSDTIEISKSYLERLLQMAVGPQSVVRQPSTDVDASKIPAITSAAHIQSLPSCHIQPERCEVPGVSCSQKQSQHHSQHQVPQTETEQEDYFPWGRPGGGAPIRTVSGTLLTNYSTRGQAVEEMRGAKVTQQTLTSTAASCVASSRDPPHKMMSSYKSPFARGMGPHVDTFVLSQREEQRRKELLHKEELAAQIAERQRQREAEQEKREREEREVEERVRRELVEINRRNEREREQRQRKAEEEKVWQAMLQARIQEAEASALREKKERGQQQKETGGGARGRPDEFRQVDREQATRRAGAGLPPSRIPLPTSHKPPNRGTDYPAVQRSKVAAHHHPPCPTVTRPTAGRQPPHPSIQSHPPPPPLSPVVPALAKKLAQHASTQPSSTAPPTIRPISPVVPALAKKLAQQTPSNSAPTAAMLPNTRPISPIVPALAKKLAQKTRTESDKIQHSTTSAPPPLPTTNSSMTINHPPLCQPSTHSPPAPLPTLPALTPSQQHTGKTFPTQPPQSVARQQTILHQLAILREGIVSQRNSLDNRLKHHSLTNAKS